MAKSFKVGTKSQPGKAPQGAGIQQNSEEEEYSQRVESFVTGKERDIVKSIRMPVSVHKRLKFYALMTDRTETDVVVELIKRELDRLNVKVPTQMS